MPAPSDSRPRAPAVASTSFVEALTDEEICPLCLDGYAPVDEAVCTICAAPACPGCVEQLAQAGAAPQAGTRCFACRPALVPPPMLPGPALAARNAAVPPPLPRRQRAAEPPPLPARSPRDRCSELDEGGLVVFPAWRKRPLLALARAADAVHLVEVSSLLVGWAYTGGRRVTLGERVSRAWSLALRARGLSLRARGVSLRAHGAALRARGAAWRARGAAWRARGADLGRYGLRLSLPLWTGLRLRGAALSRALKVRALVLAARTARLSRQLPRAARAAWSHVPGPSALRARGRPAART